MSATLDIIFLFGLLLWIILGTSWLKRSPFWVLLSATFLGAWLFEVPLAQFPEVIGLGFWGTASKIGVLIFLGSWIGITLEASGATFVIAQILLKHLARLPMHFVVGFIGYWVAIPVFCDAAFVILNNLNDRLSQASQTPKIGLTVALSSSLYATHVLVPPTPGPLAAAANFHLDAILLLFLWGGLLALILVIAGAAYAYWISRNYTTRKNAKIPALEVSETDEQLDLLLAIAPIGIPIILMALGSLHQGKSVLGSILVYASQPAVALLVGSLFSLWLIYKLRKSSPISLAKKSLQQAMPIIAITAMGGALGKVLQQVPLADYLTQVNLTDSWGILIPFLLAAFLKTAQGSSTVAILTASAIVYPLLPALGLESDLGKVWGILAIGTGAMTVSHANDSYFWIVSQVGGHDPKTALRTHTVATFIQGVLGLLLLWLTIQWMGK